MIHTVDGTVLSITKEICSDIILYIDHSKLPKVIKRFICMNKIKRLEKFIQTIKEGSSDISGKLFYDFLYDVYINNGDTYARERYSCYKLTKKANSITKPDDANMIFLFRLNLDEISDKNMKYSTDAYGEVNTKGVIKIKYELINITPNGDKHLISNYEEITDTILDSLVTLPEFNSGGTTISYKMIYTQNYFANFIYNKVYERIAEYIKNIKDEIKEI